MSSVLYSGSVPFLGISGLYGRPYTPLWFKISYKAGFDGKGQLADPDGSEEYPYPNSILDAVGLLSSMLPLDTAGDLIVGAGIASKSISFDGLSTSINTTSSATNAGYGARMISYRKRFENIMKSIKRDWRLPKFMVV
jgi:hypothetical protein